MATNGEDHEGTGEVIEAHSVVEALTRGEISEQVRTAKQYPRSVHAFITEALSLATLDEETAASCMYALPRGGKSIEGPSARLAEIVASAWGNCRSGARVIAEDDRFVTAQGFFFDVQRNYAVAFEVRRRITDSKGRKYNDDMISVTSNAACSIALRNAVFKGVPKAFWARVYDAARKTAIGDAKTLSGKVGEMLAYFAKMGIQQSAVLGAVEKQAPEDIGLDELAVLKGIATAIKEGETTIEQAFGDKPIAMPAQKATGQKVDMPQAKVEPEVTTLAAAAQPKAAQSKTTQPKTVPPAQTAAPVAPIATVQPPAVAEATLIEAPPPPEPTVAEGGDVTEVPPADAQPEPVPAVAAPDPNSDGMQWLPQYEQDVNLMTPMRLSGKAIKTAGATVVTFARTLTAAKKFDTAFGEPGHWREAAQSLFGRPQTSIYHLNENQAQMLVKYLADNLPKK